ncbi:hypothetical protein M3202_21245 [Alkalihalobacillus oceani]|uniref:Prepilin type IV endopeptidase peptidase domain-containing protein n=1 Tax=Halalkalibacter oceani TaxID=1653776 RepID=A0A9X2ISH7_9BACI|nr:hypothetical protein [Halalkalibacter oceani]MCM3716573.1 hypothetical protein [Halalkalibacter oceani]
MIMASICLIIVFAICLYTDMSSYKIKNIVTFPTAAAAFIVALFLYPVGSVLLYAAILFSIGFLGWLLRFWKAGDVKLILATGLLGIYVVGDIFLVTPVFYYTVFLGFHFIIGNFLGLKAYKFSIKTYLLSFKTRVNETFGRFPGTITIMLSFVATIICVPLLMNQGGW